MSLYTLLLSQDCFPECVPTDSVVQQLLEAVASIMEEEKQKSRTGCLWVCYMEQVSLLKTFLFAERTGDWKLHLHCIKRMIPYFHAAGHLEYAKSARLYLQQMNSLETKMSLTEYKNFTENGYFTIRRSDRFWGGNYTDQTIEQDLMRLFKSTRGMTHGRGITDSTLSKWINSFPYCVPMCEALENFAKIHTETSEQHKDLRPSSQKRDHKDFTTLLEGLKVHSPFSYVGQTSMVVISTGVVADSSVNCDDSYNLGNAAATAINGKTFTEVKLKRNDRVRNVSSNINTANIRGQSVVINPALLFNRKTCVMKSSSEMEHFLAYELAPQPPSLFHSGLMRKTRKSVLGHLLKVKVEAQSHFEENSFFVINGGYLIHTVPWPPHTSYGEICRLYVSYILTHYGLETFVVFYGYDSTNSTKVCEQQRRASEYASRDIVFNENSSHLTTKASFLANAANKSRLIEMVRTEFERKGIRSTQAEGDGDSLIATTALKVAKEHPRPVVLIGTDTDLFVILVTQATSEMKLYMCGANPPIVYDIVAIQNCIGNMKSYLMTLHAISGCDTVSAVFGQGKKKAFHLAEKGVVDFIAVFENSGSARADIVIAGEKFLLKLYGAAQAATLDKYRYACYNRSIRRASLSSSFKLESLPPTSAAARQHSYRTYLCVQQWKRNNLNPTD